ncbi:colicin immunity domain-containing protein [Nocardia carnea]|uniref:Colicin immunity domain-containing protein n=1 Tax=Nocardia carnea TaxID=37328 RepID=A0ABW7TQ42_9NOCA|nr:colicin immunity domain-containing protein [Nocardia carnea]
MMNENSAAIARMVAGYKPILESLLSGKSGADEFGQNYLHHFKNDRNQATGPDFDILDELFASVDDYVSEPALREEVGGIDEKELRVRASEVYGKLFGEHP